MRSSPAFGIRAPAVAPVLWLQPGVAYSFFRKLDVRYFGDGTLGMRTNGALRCFVPWAPPEPPFTWRYASDFAHRQRARRQIDLIRELQDMGVATPELKAAAAQLSAAMGNVGRVAIKEEA